MFDGVRLDEPGLRAAFLRREATRRAAFEARWAEKEEAATAAAAAAAAEAAARPPLEPTPPRSDSRRSRGFRARERGRERARAADREAEKAATPPPNLFEGVLRHPGFADGRDAADETDLADDYFYDDDDEVEHETDAREKTETDDAAYATAGASPGIRTGDRSDADDDAYPDFVPVDVATSAGTPTAPSARRGGGRGGTPERHRPDATTARLNRRVRALAGIMRDSLGRAGCASSEEDVRAECVALADRLRRFVAEGEGTDDDGGGEISGKGGDASSGCGVHREL